MLPRNCFSLLRLLVATPSCLLACRCYTTGTMNLRSIDETLVRQARMAAIARGISLTQYVELALEYALQNLDRPRKPAWAAALGSPVARRDPAQEHPPTASRR